MWLITPPCKSSSFLSTFTFVHYKLSFNAKAKNRSRRRQANSREIQWSDLDGKPGRVSRVDYKQAFIDNSHNEAIPFYAIPDALLRGTCRGSPKYSSKRRADGMRRSGIDVDQQIRKKTNGRIWMQNPDEYQGEKIRQWFIDNSHGEKLPFLGTPAGRLKGYGSKVYGDRRKADSHRHSGVDVDRKIRELSGGQIWMQNPDDYKGVNHKQILIDNSHAEAVPFVTLVASVLNGATLGAPKYNSQRRADAHRHSAIDVDNEMRSKTSGSIWMQNPDDYRDKRRKQILIDNSHGEAVPFSARIGDVLLGKCGGAPKYNSQRRSDAFRHCGIDVDNKIRRQSKGLIWMQNPDDYRGTEIKQAFVDNTFGEELVFFARPHNVLGQNQGAGKYRTILSGESQRIYTREKILETIAGCTSMSEFQGEHAACYGAALRQPDYDQITSALFRKGNIYKRYVYRITDDVYVYYGLTGNPETREGQYRDLDRRNNKQAVQILINGGRYELLTGLLSVEEARSKEIFLIAHPEVSVTSMIPLICVNISRGGQVGSGPRVWTKDIITEAASSCNSRTQFCDRHPGAYKAAARDGILEEVCAHMTPRYETWDIEKITTFASQCKTRQEFQKRFPKARDAAKKRKCLSEVCAHMKPENHAMLSWVTRRLPQRSSPLSHPELPLSYAA
jgi:hypothetical protein